ncbi:MAG: hypothetical protein RJB60_2389, partial [Pseudomonadota bacterium]
MKKIVLQRSVSVQCWNVLGTVAKARKRPELMPVLLRAHERSPTCADDVAEHLFFEQRSRRVVAERMLRIAETYGLLTQNDRWFTLTEAGLAALNSDQIFVPERGSWTIWASDDSLLDYPILRVEPWNEPTAWDDVQQRKNNHSDVREFVNVPLTLRRAMGRIAKPSGGGGGFLRVDNLAEKAEEADPNGELKVVWDVGDRKMRLVGTLGGSPVNTVLDAPDVASDDVWRQLLKAEGLWPDWDNTRGVLLVGFQDTNDRERESLLRDLAISAPVLSELGKFDPLTIQDVPIHAKSLHEAGHWAAWRLQSRLQDYATHERFDVWTKDAKEPFANYRISLPSR